MRLRTITQIAAEMDLTYTQLYSFVRRRRLKARGTTKSRSESGKVCGNAGLYDADEVKRVWRDHPLPPKRTRAQIQADARPLTTAGEQSKSERDRRADLRHFWDVWFPEFWKEVQAL